MHISALTPSEQRVLGCLIEKRWTTPEQYPLSLNALRLGCNQSTKRDPVTDYDEGTVRDAAQRLCRYGLARLASGHGSRTTKYRHLAEEALGLGREELAVLSVLLLRGGQTPGELKARSERMAQLRSLAEVERVVTALTTRRYAIRLQRRPGQKEDRLEHRLGVQAAGTDAARAPAARASPLPPASHDPPAAPPASASQYPPAAPPGPASQYPAAAPAAPASQYPRTAPAAPASLNGDLADRVAALEHEVAALRAEIEELRGG